MSEINENTNLEETVDNNAVENTEIVADAPIDAPADAPVADEKPKKAKKEPKEKAPAVKLLTSKKKLDTGKWQYRGFVMAKNGTEWTATVADGFTFTEDKTDAICEEPFKSAKAICELIDTLLGPLTVKEQEKPAAKAAKSKEEKEKAKNDKIKAAEKAKLVAYKIRNTLGILSKLVTKTHNDKTSTAPNDNITLKNGYKLGWVPGTYYDLPEINEEILALIETDAKAVVEMAKEYADLNINFSVDKDAIQVEVTYKK